MQAPMISTVAATIQISIAPVFLLAGIAGILKDCDRANAAAVAGSAHRAASVAAAARGDYVGTHWLASFALLADGGLPGPGPVVRPTDPESAQGSLI